MGCLAALAHFEVLVQQGTIVGVSAVVYDGFGAVYGVEVTEVGDTLVGDYHVDGVFGVVSVSHHRHDVGNQAAFGDRGA